MSDLTAKFEALEEQLDAADAATQAKLTAIQTALDFINTQLDTQTINNAANTRYLAGLLSQNSPCVDCGDVSLVVPPTGETPFSQTDEFCQRVQAFLHAMQQVYTALDVMSAFGVGFNLAVLTAAFNEVITALENGDTTPLPSFPEAVQIVGDGISYVAGNLFVGHTLVGLFAPLYFDLLKPMFQAGNAGAAQAVYNGVIDGTDYSIFEMRILEHAAYNALYSYYFDPASDPNLTGYDGTICYDSIVGITECTDYVATEVTLFGQSFHIVQTPPVSSIISWGNVGDIYHFTFEVIDGNPTGGVTVYGVTDGPPHEEPFFTMAPGDGPRLIIGHPTDFSIRTTNGNAANPTYTVRICPPS